MKTAICVALLCMASLIDCDMYDVYDTIDSLGCHEFASALQNTGPMYQLSDDNAGPFTVFAPTDVAFTKIPKYVADIFNFGNWKLAYDIVTYHITYGNVSTSQFYNNMMMPTWKGNDMRFNIYSNTSGGASIMSPGGATIVNSSAATNGMVYVIDRVLYNVPYVTMDRYIQEKQNLTNLQKLMAVGGFQETLRAQNLTLLAPNDEVFEKNPDLLKSLLGNQTLMTDLFNNHLVNTTYFSVGLTNGRQITNVAGNPILVKNNGTTVSLNGTNVVDADITVTNGVIHVINNIINHA